ncbi:MAG: hypothetical protein ACYS6K_18200, partial [Planctomycetota bacterium]
KQGTIHCMNHQTVKCKVGGEWRRGELVKRNNKTVLMRISKKAPHHTEQTIIKRHIQKHEVQIS